MASSSLEAALELWLRSEKRHVNPSFPPMLEAVFDRETAVSRLHALRVATVMGVAAGAFTAPALWLLLPDARVALLRIWCGLGMPIGIASYFILRTKLPIELQVGQTFTCGTMVALAFSLVMTSSDTALPSLYFGGMSLLVMLDVIAAGFRFRWAAAYGAVLTVMFGLFVQRIPPMHGLAGLLLFSLMATCSGFAVVGAWRVETEARRSYAWMLRERLKQDALSKRNSELDELALRDPLTGLANRRAYEAWKIETWSAGQASRSPIGLLVLDIDNFKLYNDAFGHAGGDLCLQIVGRCIVEQLRGTTDMVARIGGEEFAVLVKGASIDSAMAVAERIRHGIEKLGLPHAAGAAHAVVTVSCGAGSSELFPEWTAEQLFAEADAALYAAKRSGRNHVCPTKATFDKLSCSASLVPLGSWPAVEVAERVPVGTA